MLHFRTFLFVCLRVVEAAVSLSLSFFFVLPTLGFLWVGNSGVRALVSLSLRCHRSRKLRLTRNGLDNIWGYTAKGNHNSRTVLNVVVYERQIDGVGYRRLFEEKVLNCRLPNGSFPYKKLKERFVAHSSGFYCWEEDPGFDIKNHVVVLPDEGVMGEEGLMELLARLADDMPSEHPQWQEVIVPAFQYDQELDNNNQPPTVKSVRILRFHHAYGDAGSWLLLYSHCMADGAIPYAVNPLEGYPIPPWKEFLYYASALVFGTTTMIRNVWFGTNVRANRLLTPNYNGKKFFAWRRIQLETLKEVKKRTKTSIPTVITAAIASALRRFDATFPLTKGSGCSIGESTDCGAVAAILPYPGLRLTNRFTIANLTIPTGKGLSRKKRLQQTHQACLDLTKSPEPILNFWAFSFFGLFPIRLQNLMMRSAGTSLVFSNLPGSSQTFSLHGERIHSGGAWIPLLTTAGLTLSASGYRDSIRFCGATDSACMSKVQLEFLLETIVDEVKQLHWETEGRV